ncbi:MAG: AAA family ATPase [Thermomicrobiales bacterium]
MSPPVGPTPLIGRGRELAAILARLAAAGGGAGGAMVLAGEAGMGKSRLVAEVLADAARRGFALLRGSCFEPDRTLPYAPLLDLLRGIVAGQSPAEATPRLGPGAQTLLALLPEFAPSVPDRPTTAPDPEQDKQLILQAFARLVADRAAARPVLIVVEDIHWSDEASLDLFLAFARRIATQPVLLLLTQRSDEEHPALAHFLAELDRARLAAEVRLSPLSEAEVEALVRAIFAQDRPVRAEFVAAIHTLTEGNPFFIEEVLKALLASGDIFFAEGRWDRKPLEALRVPRTVEDAVRRRAARLDEGVRETLRLAAVVGRRVDFALIAALTGHDERTLLRHLRELIAAQLVVEESADTFVFRHALTRQAVYAELLARERRALHRQVADALERLHAAAPGRVLADLAYHCHAGEEWARALDYARQAGEQAQAMHAPRAAVVQFTRALEAASALGQNAPPALHRARGRAYETLGEFERGRDDLAAALAAQRDAADQPGEWQALLDLGFLWTSRDYAPAGEYFRQALALARESGDDARQGRSLNRLGNWHLNGGRPAEALRLYEEALAIFEDLGDRRGLAETLDLLGMASAHNGDAVAGMAYFARVVPIQRELDDRRGLVSSLTMLSELSANLPGEADVTPPGNVVETTRWAEEAVAIARSIGWRAGEAYALLGLAACTLAGGDYGRARELIKAGGVIAEEIGHRVWLVGTGMSLGGIYAEILAFSAARRHLERARAEGRRSASPGSRAWPRSRWHGSICWRGTSTGPRRASTPLSARPSRPHRRRSGPAGCCARNWRGCAATRRQRWRSPIG